MSRKSFDEAILEQAALAWLEAVGWTVRGGAESAPGTPGAERTSFAEVILGERLLSSLQRLNPHLPADVLEDAMKRLARVVGGELIVRNRALHRLLVDGLRIEYRATNGALRGDLVRFLDFERPEANDFLAIHQFTVTTAKHKRRADVVLFVNGLPLGLLELKSAVSESASVWSAHAQLRTYQEQIPKLFEPNAVLVVSDGLTARVGGLGAGREWFKPWRTIGGEELADAHTPELQVVIEGLLAPERLLPFVRDFIVFEDDGSGRIVKKLAGYHQYHAVLWAVDQTLRAAELGSPEAGMVREENGRYSTGREGGARGDRRIGVIWHTQGSGKSLTMAFYAGRIMREVRMASPTIVVMTDRNDLDGQLFDVFARCRDLLRDDPVQAESRSHLRQLLQRQAGGIVFTTIQKFLPDEKGDRHPLLSGRRNLVVIADEAHRSQYGFVDGFAARVRDALPHASFIGFTGTPVELKDANTRAVFGDYISVYDIQRSVQDGATVPIYYESRLAKLGLDERERPRIDLDFEEVTEGEEVERKEKLKSKWAQLEAVVGAERRLGALAEDLVHHFEARCEALDGKGMIVTMSRRIAVDLYRHLVTLRPEWAEEDDGRGALKVIMTGSASETEWQAHIRTKARREKLASRFRNPADPFRLVIVRDMWLTGFDAPSLHTIYLDKPMNGHGLMQAIARVNRVFRDKPGGLVVDYLGLTSELREALVAYTESGGKGRPELDQEQAVALMREKYEVCRGLFGPFDGAAAAATPLAERYGFLARAIDHVLGLERGKERTIEAVRDLSRAFALAVPREEALALRDDLAFFQAVQVRLASKTPGEARNEVDLDHAVRQIVGKAIAPEGVIDLFDTAGLPKPDLSILSDEFLAEVRGLPQRNLAVELLQRLLRGEVARRQKKNFLQSRSFADMLAEALARYQNRAIEAAQVIEELLELARRMKEADARGEKLGLSEEELAFYDALEANDSAVQVLGDDTLRTIARELVAAVREDAKIDWTLRESIQATLRVRVKRILRRHGYPPDKQEEATRTVLKQAELFGEGWE